VRSANGFVTSLTVPQGNTADCSELEPAISASIRRTGVVPGLVSTDDGYASTKGREAVLALGVKDIRISGSKGKKLTSPEDWYSDLYRDARRNRSAVESLMFTIKDCFEFGDLGRRGIEAVRDELLEKVLAYNCCRIILCDLGTIREHLLGQPIEIEIGTGIERHGVGTRKTGCLPPFDRLCGMGVRKSRRTDRQPSLGTRPMASCESVHSAEYCRRQRKDGRGGPETVF
jgi:hypothetical protein